MNQHFDLVVIGSGFGGSVQALRAAQRGWSVLVLERGSAYPQASFPRDIREVAKVFWRYPQHTDRLGLYEMRVMRGIGIVAAAGVGGGSLVYANVLIRPDASVFEDSRWPAPYRRAVLDPYFAKVEAELTPSPLPERYALVKRDKFRAAAKSLNRPIFDPPQSVNWGVTGTETGSCKLCAECEFGCNEGAKYTLDRTYLAKAQQLGAAIVTHQYVDHIRRDGASYRVIGRDLRTQAEFSVSSARVALAAGTLGTNEILMRSRDVARTLPDISARLGANFSGNGDMLGSIQHASADIAPSRGTDVTSVIRFHDSKARFTMAAPSFNPPSMELLSSLGQPSLPDWASSIAQVGWNHLESLTDFASRKGAFNRHGPTKPDAIEQSVRMTNLFCIGEDNAGGHLYLRDGRLDCEWDYAQENAALIEAQNQAMKQVADLYGGSYAPVFSWSLFRKTLSVHPLGGAVMNLTPQTGVVDPNGQVFGYPGLYVCDGAVIPTAIGFHPALTIAAVAERIAEQMH